jgi:PIN domain nuclease of toxin-antitoxin system
MILLDTHVWIWFLSNPELLSAKATEKIQTAMQDNAVCISSISVWEIAMLVKKKRLKLTMTAKDWLSKSEKLLFLNFIPVDNTIAFQSVNLPDPFHNDPADRIIVASSMSHGFPLITKDKRILSYPYVNAVW